MEAKESKILSWRTYCLNMAYNASVIFGKMDPVEMVDPYHGRRQRQPVQLARLAAAALGFLSC